MNRRRASRAVATALVAAAALACPAAAVAGNVDSFFLGNEAAATGGAVTAVTRDAGAAWYNPAGLGGSERSSLELSASAFVLRLREVPGVVRTELPSGAHGGDLESRELLTVPAALVFVRQLGPRVSAALGVFVPGQDSFRLATGLSVDDRLPGGGVPVAYGQRLEVSGQEVEYHAGPSVGVALTQTLRVGAAVHGIYRTAEARASFWLDVASDATDPPTRIEALQEQHETFGAIGVRGVLGLQWEPAASLRVGLVLRSPVVVATQWGETTALGLSGVVVPGGAVDADLAFTEQPRDSTGLDLVAPARLTGGVALVSGESWLALEGDFQAAFAEDEPGGTVAVWNARAGGTLPVVEGWHAGAGLFTDRSPQPDIARFASSQVDYYGVALGLTRSSRHALSGGPPDDLVFSTTVAIRYALGLGRFGGLAIAPFDGEAGATTVPVDVTFHELALHVGSGLRF